MGTCLMCIKTKPLDLLVVDDEQGFVRVLSKRMERRGIRVAGSHTGSRAIQLLRHQDFDAAVVDLKMEDMNGIEVLKIFKKMVPELPVIMLTGHGCEAAAKEGMASGAAEYLTKPCSLDELIDVIRRAAGPAGEEAV